MSEHGERAPRVSVCMITYNHEVYIAQAIEGVLMQETDFTIELLIHDDASTDGTAEIVREYEKKHPHIIKSIYQTENQYSRGNPPWFINLERARGEYIAYCEGDDYWTDPRKLQKQVDYMNSHPDCGLVASDYDLVTAKDSRRVERYQRSLGRPFLSDPKVEDILTGRAGVKTLTVLARRALVEEIRGQDQFLYTSGQFLMGDTQLWAEISLRSQIHVIDQSTATHLVLEESATQSRDRSKVRRFRMNGAELSLYLIDKHDLPDYLRKIHQESWTGHAIRLAFAENDAEMAEQARKRFGCLSWKGYVLYLGIQYPLVRWILEAVAKIERDDLEATLK